MDKSTSSPENPAYDDNKEEIKETLNDQKNDPAVKDALKKEQQPVSPDDLSSLHNNREIGTSGGGQRVSQNEENGEN